LIDFKMSKLGSWFRGPPVKAPASPAKPTSKESLDPVDESDHLEHAMNAATLIMNDDIDGAEAQLMLCDSAFHQLGRGVTKFMRSVLGWEQEEMRQAAAQLNECENIAWADFKRSQKEGSAYHSNVYPPGSEFSLILATAQLMGAVVAVLNESLTESIRAFYKLRKAYTTLDSIMEAETRYRNRLGGPNGGSKSSLSSRVEKKQVIGEVGSSEAGSRPSTRGTSHTNVVAPLTKLHDSANSGAKTPLDDEEGLEFVDADEAHSGAQTPANYLGHVATNEAVDAKLNELSLSNGGQTPENSDPNTPPEPVTPKIHTVLDDGPNSDIFENPIDVFVHSGVNLNLGILLLILSMVPPAFSKLLYVVGFKGDRERGIRMLWQATKFPNINGAMAGLVLLGYYNGLLGFSDIILTDNEMKDDNITGFPKAKCEALLRDMRARYPVSRLWRLEEARMLSGNRQLKAAIEALEHNSDSPMKQVSSINMFEKSMDAMYIHDYSLCSISFIKCVELNSWSHALYYFIAGIAQVELYRDVRVSDPEAAKIHKMKAMEYLKMAPTHSGKKKFLAKQLPFDLYVVRKMQKWEERAHDWSVDLVDAIGVSPVEEMIYLWNGSKRMNASELEDSLANLEWNRVTHPEKHTSNLDETAIHALLKATLLRGQNKFDESKQLLKTEILSHDRYEFTPKIA
jgi:hypothetical protein